MGSLNRKQRVHVKGRGRARGERDVNGEEEYKNWRRGAEGYEMWGGGGGGIEEQRNTSGTVGTCMICHWDKIGERVK
jgi:hypothetical protein